MSSLTQSFTLYHSLASSATHAAPLDAGANNGGKKGKKGNQQKKGSGKGQKKQKKFKKRPTMENATCRMSNEARKKLAPFYVTTAINYTNGAPHMGHAYEATATDCLARYHRIFGRKTFFLTGSDEHGQKIAQRAEKEGCTPKQICDKYCKGFKALNKKLLITNDHYIRTTDAKHEKLCQDLWAATVKKGDIYLGSYKGWYSIREERFITESDAQKMDYKDGTTGQPLTQVEEPSYFFRMSKYQDWLINHIETNEHFVQPQTKRNNLLKKLKSEKLRDLSLSRTTFDWGIPVPAVDTNTAGGEAPGSDEKHVMYVWYDALSNYLSGLKDTVLELDEKTQQVKLKGDRATAMWPHAHHIIGKDIIWFHSVIWPCMLKSVGIKAPECIFAHGFINAADGAKMSKSVGNVVDPVAILEKFPVDTLRYYLLVWAQFGSDMPFSIDTMVNAHNGEINKVIGNLLNRVFSLINKNYQGKIPVLEEGEQRERAKKERVVDVEGLRAFFEKAFSKEGVNLDELSSVESTIAEATEGTAVTTTTSSASNVDRSGFNMDIAGKKVVDGFRQLNKYIQDKAPWLAPLKNDEVGKAICFRNLLESVYVLAHFLFPFLPETAELIFNSLGVRQSNIAALNPYFNLPEGGKNTVASSFPFFQLTVDGGKLNTSGADAKAKAAEEKAKRKAEIEAAKKAKKERAKQQKQKSKKGAKNGGSAATASQPVFTKVDIRVGQITKVWNHPDAENLFCEEIECGEDAPRKIASGLRQHYSLEEMEGRRLLVVCNLKAANLRGFKSHGMVLCAKVKDESCSAGERVEFVDPPADAKVGERVGYMLANGTFSGATFEPVSSAQMKKHKVFDVLKKTLSTNGDKVAQFSKDEPSLLCTASGALCTAPSLANAVVS